MGSSCLPRQCYMGSPVPACKVSLSAEHPPREGKHQSTKVFDINRTKESRRGFSASLVVSLPLLSQPVLQARDTSKLLCTSVAVDFSHIFWEREKKLKVFNLVTVSGEM